MAFTVFTDPRTFKRFRVLVGGHIQDVIEPGEYVSRSELQVMKLEKLRKIAEERGIELDEPDNKIKVFEQLRQQLYREKQYRPEDGPFWSDKDLRVFNTRGSPPKFGIISDEIEDDVDDLERRLAAAKARKARAAEAADESAHGDSGEPNLEKLTVEQLRQLAVNEDIDVAGLTKKADLIAAIRAAAPAEV